MSASEGSIVVETTARLHFGVLDLRRSQQRWFGGLGAAAPGPRLRIAVRPAATVEATGPDADRAAEFGNRFLRAYGRRGGANIEVREALPGHAGLGSGTQLGLAVARALAELHGIRATTPELARAVGRGARSAVGTWTFDGGGLVLEGGRRRDTEAPGPLLTRLRFPAGWRCIVVVPDAQSGLTGDQEDAAFRDLPAPPSADIHAVAHLVLMSLLPSVAEDDIRAFGDALTRIQEITGAWFAAAQGGTFQAGPTTRVIQRMKELGAAGVGQSSWGPAAYGIVEGDDAARRLASAMTAELAGRGRVIGGAFPSEGARLWREP